MNITGTEFISDNVTGKTASVSSEGELSVRIVVKLITLLQALLSPAWWDASLNRLRGTVIIESGTVTTVSTVTTVTTVATVTGLTNIDSLQGKLLIIDNEISAWANNCRALIT